MTVSPSIDPARLLEEQLAQASPDLLRELLTTFINTLMSAEADAVCGAAYGTTSPDRTNRRNGYRARDRRRVRRRPRDHGRCAMTTAVARVATEADHDWLANYIDHCHALGCCDRALRDRLRAARTLLTAHPDLTEWMHRHPTQDRLVELCRTKAWPLVGFLIGTRRLRLDLEPARSEER